MRKATYALFHSSIHVKGAGEMGTNLPCQAKTLDDLDMSYGTEGLVVSGAFRGIKIKFVVPPGNIRLVQLVPGDDTPTTDGPKPEKPKALKAA